MVVNAAGPWGAMLLDSRACVPRWPLLKAMNLVTSRPARKAALVGADARRACAGAAAMAGTNARRHERVADAAAARRSGRHDAAKWTRFLREVNETFPAFGLKPDEVTLVHRGIVPAAESGGRLSLLGHSRIIDHAQRG